MLERANQVIGQINAIGTVTVDSQQKIDDAQKAYDALSDEEKKYVTNYAVLDKAKVQLTVLQEAQAVIDKINGIGNVTLSSEDDIRAARSAYDLLSNDAKSHVNNIDKLKRAENNFESLRNSSGDTEPDDDAASNYGTFYWVPSGKVYHTTRDCPTLSRSKTIRSGSVPPSGRHICKVCS